LAGFKIDNNGYSFASVNTVCPAWSGQELADVDLSNIVFTISEFSPEAEGSELWTTYKVVTTTQYTGLTVTFTTTSTSIGLSYDGARDVSYVKGNDIHRQFSVVDNDKPQITPQAQHECYEQLQNLGEGGTQAEDSVG
jgi:hypothetical protein